jgi:broad specificity phosphatase PhoE
MELLLEEIGLPQNQYRSDRRLMEGDLGDHTGLLGPSMLGHPDYMNSVDPWNYTRPNGESVAMVHERVGQFLASLVSDSVIVTHALPASMIRAHALGLLREGTNFELGNTGILKVTQGTATLF